jgi:hypothetical protein
MYLLWPHRLEKRARQVGGGEAAAALARPAERLQRAGGGALVLARLLDLVRLRLRLRLGLGLGLGLRLRLRRRLRQA